jgi:hypothetical protein
MASWKPKYCSCYVLFINYILRNKVVLDYIFIYFINEQSVFDPRKESEMFSLPNRPDHSGGHSSFTAVQDVSVPRDKSDRALKLTTAFDTVPRFRVRGFMLPPSPTVCTAWCSINQNRRLTLYVTSAADTYLSNGQIWLILSGPIDFLRPYLFFTASRYSNVRRDTSGLPAATSANYISYVAN